MNSVNLGPGNTVALFQIPTEFWTKINKRVFLVLAGQRGGEYFVYRTMPNYQNLVNVCKTWKSTTFPGLITLCKTINSFIDKDVTTNFNILQNAVDELQKGNTDATIQAQFTQVMATIKEDLNTLQKQTVDLATQITQFSEVNQQVDAEYHQTSAGKEWVVLKPSPSNIEHAIKNIRGVCDSISSDIAHMEREFTDSISKGSLFMMNLGLEATLKNWLRVKDAIQQFVSGSVQQQKYLDGDWLYDDPKIGAGWYRLTNKLLGDNRFLDVTVMNNGGNHSGSFWKFTRMGAGWYKLTNMFMGDNRFLDTDSNKSNALFMNDGSPTPGSLWKLSPS